MAGTSNTGGAGQGNLDVKVGTMPKEGPRVIPVRLDYTTFDTYNIDLTPQQQGGQFSFVQTVYIDNSDNAAALQLIASATGQRIVVPPNGMCYMPFLQPNPPQMQAITTPAGGLIVGIMFLNFYVPPIVWKKT